MTAALVCWALPGLVVGTETAERVRIGFVTTLSGPGASIGADIRDGFQLATRLSADRLGGLTVQLQVVDDAANPETGKAAVERMVRRDHVDVMTGVVFSNVLLAVLPTILEAETVYLSPNTGPQEYAGEKCNPYFYAVAWQNEDMSFATGRFVADRGYRAVHAIAPNYAGGRETVNGFKRGFPGTVTETYTKLGQLDYAPELSTLRAANSDALFIFLPGGMGINFIKQFVAAGMSRSTQLMMTGISADEDSITALGDTLLGAFNTSEWAHDLDNEANRRFVAAFRKAYGRLPTMYAAQGYDTARLLDRAIADVKGRIEDKAALRRALEAARFQSVRGSFAFNSNHFPIQDIYLRVVSKTADGRITNRTIGTVVSGLRDAYAGQCRMPR